MLDFETCYLAMASRDPRFDGRFVVAVTSTGVYCRPVCPSRTPKRANTRFFAVPAAAEVAGFRACRRCRPETAPESPEWNARGDLTARALRMITNGVVDEIGVGGLARRLAVSERHLHRALVAEVGVGPQSLALNRRARTARMLIESGRLPLTDIAFAAGYASVRQFNHGMRAAFGCTPSELRSGSATVDGPLTVRLRYRPPLDAEHLLSWLASRALPGVESVTAGEYRRTVQLPRSTGVITLRFSTNAVLLRLSLGDLRDVTVAVQRCRELLDLDADPAMIADVLAPDPALGPLLARRPGLRVPGCVDGFELATRVILGRRAADLAHRFGEPLPAPDGSLTHLFPTPETLADVPDSRVRGLARAVLAGAVQLDRSADRAETVARLREIRGIGQATAARIAMHALGDPDILPGRHPRAHRWRPWRAYAAMHLEAGS